MTMRQPTIIAYVYDKLSDKDAICIDDIKNVLGESDFRDFKTYIRLFSKTLFRTNFKDITEDKVHQIMVLRREIYVDDPTDEEEYKELIEYFEDEEDYESCLKINKSRNEHNKTRKR